MAELGPAAAELAVRGVVLAGGVPLDEVDLGRPDLVVVSPGVPLRAPVDRPGPRRGLSGVG